MQMHTSDMLLTFCLLLWLMKHVSKPLFFFNFQISPKTGPTAGGTLLTIKGNNFGYKESNVFIGDSVKKCSVSFSNNTV